jgi:hypothetical protein
MCVEAGCALALSQALEWTLQLNGPTAWVIRASGGEVAAQTMMASSRFATQASMERFASHRARLSMSSVRSSLRNA